MKISLSLLCLLSALPLCAVTTSNLTSGHIYDVGKGSYSSDPTVTDKADTSLCWAYSAANLLQFWQDYYLSSADAGDEVPNGYNNTSYTSPKGTQYLTIADVFRNNWKDEGGMQHAGFQWWFQGTEAVEDIYAKAMKDGAIEAGYYKTLFGSETCYKQQYLAEENTDNGAVFMNFIDDTLATAGQGLGLAIYKSNGTGGHAITCWGYETDEDGTLSALYVTDSDDRYYGATRVQVEIADDGTIAIYDNDETSYHSSTLYYVIAAEAISTPTSVAQTSSLSASLPTGGVLTENVRIASATELNSGVTVGEQFILSSQSGSLKLSGQEGTGLAVQEGGMVSLAHLDELNISGFEGAGLSAGGKTYITDADKVSISGNKGFGLKNTTYTELNGCGEVSISGNSASATSGQVLGGGISNQLVMGVLENESLSVSSNTVTGSVVAGGGMLTQYSYWDENGGVEFKDNAASGTSMALGGAIYSFYLNEISDNESLTFSGNSAKATGSSSSAQALGGAIMQSILSSTGTGSTLISGNGTVVFSENGVSADSGYALGGAVYVDNGAKITLSGSEDAAQSLTFSGNWATGAAAAGGAIASWGTVSITGNSSVSFDGNEAAFGGAVFNAGTLSLSKNGAVSVTNNVSEGYGAFRNTGTMEIVWNDSFTSSGNNVSIRNGEDADIVNTGTLYLAAEEGHSLTLSSALDSYGTTYLGSDAAGTTGSGTLQLTSTVLSTGEGETAEIVNCSVTESGIEALSTSQTATLRNLDILVSDGGSYSLTSLNLSQDCSVTAGTLTLSNVSLTYDATPESSALSYTIDLSKVFSGAISGDLHVNLSSSLLQSLYSMDCKEITVAFGDKTELEEDSSVSLNNGYRVSGGSGSVTFLLPEPGSATLALFALAAACVRRRRVTA